MKFALALQKAGACDTLRSMNIFRTALLALACATQVATAQFGMDFGFGGGDQQALVTTTAQASVTGYKPGEAFYVSLKASAESPWHTYFRNPATMGMPIEAALQAPEGYQVEGPYWQPPHRIEDSVGVAYAYTDAVAVWKITPPANATGEAAFTITTTAQACKEGQCSTPETSTTSITVAAGDGTTASQWNATEKTVEVLGDTPLAVTASQSKDAVQLHFTCDDELKNVYFFSEDNSIDPTVAQPLTRDGNNYTLTLPRNKGTNDMYPLVYADTAGKPLATIKGILTYDGKHTGIDQAPGKESVSGLPAGFGGIILYLFLGGLILNLMPCVFPVIGLKIMSFVELGGGSRTKVVLHSLAFVLGILISFWLLGIMLIALSNAATLATTPWNEWLQTLWQDAGSESRKWAVWMQNPWVIYAITLLLTVVGLSMYGVFEIGVGATGAGQKLQSKGGLTGSFFQGLFITIVATPCSAPFLGAAMPAAMALPGVWMVIALTFMALGLAFPYIVLGLFPSLVSKLPRPGAWMESLRQGLSFCLFLAAAWLLSVYLSFMPEEDPLAVMFVLTSLVIFCAAFWVYGRWCPMYRSRKSRIMGLIVALLLAVGGIWGGMPSTGKSDTTDAPPEWQNWTPEAMQEALANGNPVYVDFTAKWCATCQYNKMTAYSEEVYAEMKRAGVVLMRADATEKNADIESEMQKLGRTSVPVNVLYTPKDAPAITPELLTPGVLLDFLTPKLTSYTADTVEEHEEEGELDEEAAADAEVEEAEPETEEEAE